MGFEKPLFFVHVQRPPQENAKFTRLQELLGFHFHFEQSFTHGGTAKT